MTIAFGLLFAVLGWGHNGPLLLLGVLLCVLGLVRWHWRPRVARPGYVPREAHERVREVFDWAYAERQFKGRERLP